MFIELPFFVFQLCAYSYSGPDYVYDHFDGVLLCSLQLNYREIKPFFWSSALLCPAHFITSCSWMNTQHHEEDYSLCFCLPNDRFDSLKYVMITLSPPRRKPATNAINVPFCSLVVLNELYLFIPCCCLTSAILKGDSSIKWNSCISQQIF